MIHKEGINFQVQKSNKIERSAVFVELRHCCSNIRECKGRPLSTAQQTMNSTKLPQMSMPAMPTISAGKLGDIKLFQKNLSDVIKGVRSHKDDLPKYIAQITREIKDELKSADMNSKAMAVQKLTYVSKFLLFHGPIFFMSFRLSILVMICVHKSWITFF
jgi:hypothetical protein